MRIYAIDVIEQKSSGNEKTLRNISKQHDTAINSILYIRDVFKSKIVQQYNNNDIINRKAVSTKRLQGKTYQHQILPITV